MNERNIPGRKLTEKCCFVTSQVMAFEVIGQEKIKVSFTLPLPKDAQVAQQFLTDIFSFFFFFFFIPLGVFELKLASNCRSRMP